MRRRRRSPKTGAQALAPLRAAISRIGRTERSAPSQKVWFGLDCLDGYYVDPLRNGAFFVVVRCALNDDALVKILTHVRHSGFVHNAIDFFVSSCGDDLRQPRIAAGV